MVVPHFDHSDSWGSGSFKSESIAVEKQVDGTFSLAVKKTDKFTDYNGNPETHINWEVVSIKSDGTVDWNNTIWGGIIKHENKFKQDLNLDGGIGLAAALTPVSSDTTGAKLMRDADNALYIDIDGDTSTTNDILSITDEWGGAPTFDFQDSWSGNSHKSESVAVELQSDGSYKLAIKKTDDWGDGEHINWEVLTTDSSGVIDWNKSTWGGITKQEQYFNQDLNSDGGIGLAASLSSVSSDTIGAKLMRDADNALYIDIDGDTSTTNDILSITDEWGGTPTFDYQDSWSGILTNPNLLLSNYNLMVHINLRLKRLMTGVMASILTGRY